MNHQIFLITVLTASALDYAYSMNYPSWRGGRKQNYASSAAGSNGRPDTSYFTASNRNSPYIDRDYTSQETITHMQQGHFQVPASVNEYSNNYLPNPPPLPPSQQFPPIYHNPAMMRADALSDCLSSYAHHYYGPYPLTVHCLSGEVILVTDIKRFVDGIQIYGGIDNNGVTPVILTIHLQPHAIQMPPTLQPPLQQHLHFYAPVPGSGVKTRTVASRNPRRANRKSSDSNEKPVKDSLPATIIADNLGSVNVEPINIGPNEETSMLSSDVVERPALAHPTGYHSDTGTRHEQSWRRSHLSFSSSGAPKNADENPELVPESSHKEFEDAVDIAEESSDDEYFDAFEKIDDLRETNDKPVEPKAPAAKDVVDDYAAGAIVKDFQIDEPTGTVSSTAQSSGKRRNGRGRRRGAKKIIVNEHQILDDAMKRTNDERIKNGVFLRDQLYEKLIKKVVKSHIAVGMADLLREIRTPEYKEVIVPSLLLVGGRHAELAERVNLNIISSPILREVSLVANNAMRDIFNSFKMIRIVGTNDDGSFLYLESQRESLQLIHRRLRAFSPNFGMDGGYWGDAKLEFGSDLPKDFIEAMDKVTATNNETIGLSNMIKTFLSTARFEET